MIYIVTIWDRLFISFFKKYEHAFHYLFSLLYAFFIQVPVPSQESERSCMYIRCIDFASFYNIDSDFGIALILFRFYKLTFNYVMLLLTICTWSKTTDTTIETGTAYPSGASELPSVLNGFRDIRSLVFCVCFVDRCMYFVF